MFIPLLLVDWLCRAVLVAAGLYLGCKVLWWLAGAIDRMVNE